MAAARVVGPCARQRHIAEPHRPIAAWCDCTATAFASRVLSCCRRSDASDDTVEVGEDILLGEAKYAPAEGSERPVPRRVVPLSILVVSAVDLDDETDLGGGEVDDEVSDDELTAEGKSGLRAGEAAPEPLLRAGWREAHVASTLLEEASLLRRDECASEHEELREHAARECAERSPPRRFRAARSGALMRATGRSCIAKRWGA